MKSATRAQQGAQRGIGEQLLIAAPSVPRPSSRFCGLTLVELVIVCGIIAMLAGILWVVMGPVREKARQTVCISNLTQIGHAFRMYRDDWDGVEPQKGVQLEYWQLGLPPEKGSPNKSVTPYLKTSARSLWVCPSEFRDIFLRTASYVPNYCTHQDANLFGYQYDKCLLWPGGVVSFKWAVSHIPDWPFLYCDTHHFLKDPNLRWKDMFLIIVRLDDFSVTTAQSTDYVLRLPTN